MKGRDGVKIVVSMLFIVLFFFGALCEVELIVHEGWTWRRGLFLAVALCIIVKEVLFIRGLRRKA